MERHVEVGIDLILRAHRYMWVRKAKVGYERPATVMVGWVGRF
jgi:hypothetical protein